ncbi:MAG: helix-turn-helix domain-containing protein [Planctomycetes bacterium]|nr:helix-turn-helix domain-containing protein [Planctomycetota bacterium]
MGGRSSTSWPTEFTERLRMTTASKLRDTINDLRQQLEDLEAELPGFAEQGRSVSGGQLWLSPQEFADLTSFSVHTVRDWCQERLIPAERIGNRLRIPRDRAMIALRQLNRRRRRRRNGI